MIYFHGEKSALETVWRVVGREGQETETGGRRPTVIQVRGDRQPGLITHMPSPPLERKKGRLILMLSFNKAMLTTLGLLVPF